MKLYVELSIDMAPRIQDLAELQWSAIKEIKDGEDKGYGLVYLKKLKSTERIDVMINPSTMKLVKEYKETKGIEKNIWPSEKIFKNNSANSLLIRIKRFFLKHGINDFQSHNFRKTTITNFYRQNNDIDLTCSFAGHKRIDTTRIYIETDKKEEKKQHKLFLQENSQKRMRLN